MKIYLLVPLSLACISTFAFAQTTTRLQSQLGWASFQVPIDVPIPTKKTPDYSKLTISGSPTDVHFYSYLSEKAEPTLFSFSKPEIEFKNVRHLKTTDGKELYTADIVYRFYVTAKITSKDFAAPSKPVLVDIPGLKSVSIQGGKEFSTFTNDFVIQGVEWLIEPVTTEQDAAANP